MIVETFSIPNNGQNTRPFSYDAETFIKCDKDLLIVARDFGTSDCHWTVIKMNQGGDAALEYLARIKETLRGLGEPIPVYGDFRWFKLTETWGIASIWVNEITFAHMVSNLLENGDG